jgi:hypothetical protein
VGKTELRYCINWIGQKVKICAENFRELCNFRIRLQGLAAKGFYRQALIMGLPEQQSLANKVAIKIGDLI